MNVVQKSVDAAIQPVESDNPNGEFEVVLSTDALDRDGERLYIDEWKQPLPKRIQIDGDHSRSIEKTVGSVVPRIEGNKLIGKGSYAPTAYAQDVRKIASDKAADGHALSLSVTFSEHKNQKDGGIQRELLNAGFVAIPANAECVVLSSKSAKIDKDAVDASGNPPEVKHDDMVQAIHDAACHLGAQCANEIEADPGTSDGANKSIQFELETFGSKEFTDLTEAWDWLASAVGVDKSTAITVITKSSGTEIAGSPQESADKESAAAAKAAAAEDKSADDTAYTKAKEAEKARALAFLIRQNTKDV